MKTWIKNNWRLLCCSLGGILVGYGLSKIHQETTTKQVFVTNDIAAIQVNLIGAPGKVYVLTNVLIGPAQFWNIK